MKNGLSGEIFFLQDCGLSFLSPTLSPPISGEFATDF